MAMVQHRQHLQADAVLRKLPKNVMDVSHWSWQILRPCLQSKSKYSALGGIGRSGSCRLSVAPAGNSRSRCRHQAGSWKQPSHAMEVPCFSLRAREAASADAKQGFAAQTCTCLTGQVACQVSRISACRALCRGCCIGAGMQGTLLAHEPTRPEWLLDQPPCLHVSARPSSHNTDPLRSVRPTSVGKATA